jgi:head-tail adaptor
MSLIGTRGPALRPHRVTLQNPGEPVPDGAGGFTEAWTDLAPPLWWCSMKPAAALDMERVVGGVAVSTTATHIVQGPYHPGITPATRLLLGARVLQVQSVQNDDGRNTDLTLVCSEVR